MVLYSWLALTYFVVYTCFKNRLTQQVLTVPWPVIAESRFQSLIGACGMCGGESFNGTGFFTEYFGLILSLSFHGYPAYSFTYHRRCIIAAIYSVFK